MLLNDNADEQADPQINHHEKWREDFKGVNYPVIVATLTIRHVAGKNSTEAVHDIPMELLAFGDPQFLPCSNLKEAFRKGKM